MTLQTLWTSLAGSCSTTRCCALLAALALFLPGPLKVCAAEMPESPDPFGFSESQYSSLGLTDRAWPYRGRHGCWPVGNGICFAHLGVDADFNTLHGITGPGYQTRDAAGKAVYWQDGDWPALPVQLMRRVQVSAGDGSAQYEQVSWEMQSIQVLRSAAMVRVKQSSGSLTLWSLTYALPGGRSIVREFALTGGVADQFALSVDRSGASFDEQDIQSCGEKRVFTSAMLPISGEHRGRTLFGFIEDSRDPSILRSSLQLTFFTAQETRQETGQSTDGFTTEVLNKELALENGAAETYRYWQDWSSRTPEVDDPALKDLMLQLPVTLETQRDAASGGVSPMVSYHGYWVRDSLGPILTYLAAGRFDDVRRMLTYHRKACWKLGSCSMLVPLNVDISGVKEGDWSKVPVEHAEVPSLIVLEHYWYWKACRDAGRQDDGFIREAWPFLRRNLYGMQFDKVYGVKFHGDETYTQGALYSTFDFDTTRDGAALGSGPALGYPNGYIPTEFFSLDNTWLHLNAAYAMQKMAAVLSSDAESEAAAAAELSNQLQPALAAYLKGSVDCAISPITGQPWLDFFSNIDYGIQWPILPLNADGVANSIMRFQTPLAAPDPLGASTSDSGYHTGHNLAGYLWSARLSGNAALARRTVDALLAEAGPDGAWCEVYDGTGLPVNIYGRINRIRPWESGVNYATLLDYCRNKDELRVGAGNQEPLPPTLHIPAIPGAKLLVLSQDLHYRELLPRDYRLSVLQDREIDVWDIGLPIRVADLRIALLGSTAAETLQIPYLYLDRDIKLPSRRNFKTAAFWEGAQMQQLLLDYAAAGGTVLSEADLRPAWTVSYDYRSNREGLAPINAPFDPGIEIDLQGPSGRYRASLIYDETLGSAASRLADEGLIYARGLPRFALEPAPGEPVWLELNPRDWEAVQYAAGTLRVEYRSDTGVVSSFEHPIAPVFPLSYRLSQMQAEPLPAWIPAAKKLRSAADNKTPDWSSARVLHIDQNNGKVFNGPPAALEKFSAELQFAYDDSYLYVAGKVSGAAMRSGELWTSDRLNLVFDAGLNSSRLDYPDPAGGKDSWPADDYWIFLAPFVLQPDKTTAPVAMRVGGSNEIKGNSWSAESRGFYGEIEGSSAVVQLSEAGDIYRFEWRIPLASLPFLQATPREFTGLTIFYSSNGETMNEIMYPSNWAGPQGIEWRIWDCGLLYFEP